MSFGEVNLSDVARSQIASAKRDPRLDRGTEAMVADFWAAMEEAERVRTLGYWGLYKVAQAHDREQDRLDISADDPAIAPADAATLQAAWERSEMAQAELNNEHPHMNAQALLSMNSALDAVVEQFVPAMQRIAVKSLATQLLDRAKDQVATGEDALGIDAVMTPDVEEVLRLAVEEMIAEKLPKVKRAKGSGVKRYEDLLGSVKLAAPADRPIPDDLDEALKELGVLRDVLMHRAGRVDKKALEQAPTLRYKEGDLVRISRRDYRTYSAAIRCYAAEIWFRSIRHWPEVTDEEDGPNLGGWRGYHLLNA